MSVAFYPGTCRDRHGEERLRFGNGREPSTTIRGVDFPGGDFDMLAAADATPHERLASFSLNRGDLSEYTFTPDIPLPVVVPAPGGAETIAWARCARRSSSAPAGVMAIWTANA